MTLAQSIPAIPAEVIPGLFAVDVLAKHPGSTYFVRLEVNALAMPKKLVDDFAEAGFLPAPHSAPPLNRDGFSIAGLDLVRPGSGLFNGWTTTERVANLAEIKAILTLHGLRAAPRVAQSWEFM